MIKINKLPNDIVIKIVDDLFKSKDSYLEMRDFVC